MNNTQKALINQDICEQTTPNLGITQSSGLEAHRLYETIRGGKRITTAQVSVEEFKSCLKNIWGFIS